MKQVPRMPSSNAQAIRNAVIASYRTEGSLYGVLREQYRKKTAHPPPGFIEYFARAELLPFAHLPEQEALAAFIEYSVFKEIRTEADTALLEQAIRRGLKLLTQDEIEVLKEIDDKGQMFHWGLLLEATSDIKPIRLIQHIKWGMGKDEIRRGFSGKQPLLIEPGYNEIGFLSPSYGLPASFFFYFTSGMFGRDKLVRIHILYFFFLQRPPDSDIERAYLPIRNDLVTEYGQPRDEMPNPKDIPPEFRLSQLLVWTLSDSILTLSCGLLRDGVPPDSDPIAVGYGDRKRDPISQTLDH